MNNERSAQTHSALAVERSQLRDTRYLISGRILACCLRSPNLSSSKLESFKQEQLTAAPPLANKARSVAFSKPLLFSHLIFRRQTFLDEFGPVWSNAVTQHLFNEQPTYTYVFAILLIITISSVEEARAKRYYLFLHSAGREKAQLK